MLIAHISDLHIDNGQRSRERAQRVLAYVAAMSDVDLVVLTGDLTDHGRPEEYAELAELLQHAGHPVAHCPGNHDVREAYREVLRAEAPSGDPVNHAVRAAGRLVLLADSSVPGEDHGHLSDETLAWLDRELATGEPAVVCLHHPPSPVHIPYVDDILLRNHADLAAVLDRHPQVSAVLCGHVHTATSSVFAQRPVLTAAAVASTLRLPSEPGWQLDTEAAPGLALHVFDDDTVCTHFRAVHT